jgi:phosphonate transport system substrate-binding protein
MKQFLFWQCVRPWRKPYPAYRAFKQIISFLLLFSISAIGTSCQVNNSQNPAQSTATPKTNSTVSQPLRVAVIPWQSPEEQQQKLQPLADYLQKILQRPVSFQISKDYATAVDLLVNQEVDMAYLAALTYIKARDRNPNIEPLVVPIDQITGRPWYTSIIIADTTKGIKSLSDLKGKRFAFVSPSSTSGFLMPLNGFQKQGIEPTRDFTKIRYSGSHDKAQTDLKAGIVDAIAEDRASFLRSQKSGKLSPTKYKIIWESDPIPSPPIVINTKKFSPEVIAKLRQALIDAPVGVVDVSGTKSAGYTLGKDADFEQIRQIYHQLKSVTVAAKE